MNLNFYSSVCTKQYILKFSYILLIGDESYTFLIPCVCWFLPFQSLASESVCRLQVHLRFVWQFDYRNTKPRDMQPKSTFHREIPRRHHLGILREPKNEIERILEDVIDEVEIQLVLKGTEFWGQMAYVQFQYNVEHPPPRRESDCVRYMSLDLDYLVQSVHIMVKGKGLN